MNPYLTLATQSILTLLTVAVKVLNVHTRPLQRFSLFENRKDSEILSYVVFEMKRVRVKKVLKKDLTKSLR